MRLLDMLLQTRLAPVSHPAGLAHIRLGVRVREHVLSLAHLRAELLFANGARVGVLPGVNANVDLAVELAGEALVAVRALVRLLPGVYALVVDELVLLPEALVAVAALELFLDGLGGVSAALALAAVLVAMLHEGTSLREGLVALLAMVGLLAGVEVGVVLQRRLDDKGLGAECALEWFFTWKKGMTIIL